MAAEWFVLRTHYNQEQRAARDLSNQRVRSFLPLSRIEKRRQGDGEIVAKVRPLFPRYLFVQFTWERDFRKVIYARGVHSFVGYSQAIGKPPVVHKEIIRELRSRLEEVYGLDVLVLERVVTIEPGDMVRILFGPWRDKVAPVKSVVGDRVEVLLDLFGITVSKRVHRDALVRVGTAKALPKAA